MPTERDPLAELLAASAAADTTQLYVLHRNVELASVDGRGGPLHTASVTKLVVGTAIGRAVRLGRFALDDPVHRWFPEWVTGPRAAITVRHVMGHVSSLAHPWNEADDEEPGDLLAYVLDELPLAHEPGTHWAYNNFAGMLLPAIVSRSAGMPFFDVVRTELFEPLGIDDWTWLTDAGGNPLGMSGLRVDAADLAKVGQLLVQDGDWVAECRQPPIPGVRGAGLSMFDRGPAVGHTGTGGQHLWIYPASGLVIARLRRFVHPDTGAFEPYPPEQEFPDLPALGAGLERSLGRTGYPDRDT